MIHFENDIEELQQWDQQVKLVAVLARSTIWCGRSDGSQVRKTYVWWGGCLQIVNICQALNDVLESMVRKSMPVAV